MSLYRRRHGVAGRRSNIQRSAEMKNRLLHATIECLIKYGYNRITTTMVADRAAVSRGAFLHHFRTKQELVLSAVQHLFELRNAEFVAAFNRLPPDADRPAAALDLLWRILGGDTFYAWLELAVAGRSDEKLGARVRELGTRTAKAVENTFRDLFPAPRTPNPFFDTAPKFVFAVLQGLALDRLLADSEHADAEQVLTLLKRLSPFAIQPGGRP